MPPAAVVSTNGRYAFLGNFNDEQMRDETLMVDLVTAEQVGVLNGWPGGVSHDGSVAWTTDGGTAWVWDLSSGVPEAPVLETELPGWFWMSPDGSQLANTSEISVQLFDATSGEEVDSLLTGLGSNDLPSFSANGTRILVNEIYGETAVVFGLDITREIASLELCPGNDYNGFIEAAGGTTAVRSFCGNQADDPTQFLIDSDSFTMRDPNWESAGARGALSPDGTLIAGQYTEGEGWIGPIQLHDTDTGDIAATLEGMCVHSFKEFPDCAVFPDTPYADWAWNMAYSSDGSMLAMAGDNSDGVAIYDVGSAQLVATPVVTHNTEGPDRALDVAFNPDGTSLAASFGWAPKELWLLSTTDWVPITQFAADEIGEPPSSNLIFTPDGHLVLATDWQDAGQGRIVFMNAETLEVVGEIPDAHNGGINQLDISRDGTLVASAGLDGFVRVWDIATRTLVHQIPVANDGSALGGVAFMDDGGRLSVTSQGTGEVHLVTTDVEELLDIARSRVTRSFTATECDTYRIDSCGTGG